MSRRQKQLERNEVSEWEAPAEMVRIANERTDGMLAQFMQDGARYNELARVIRSAYMQGVNDTIDAIMRTGTFVPGPALTNKEADDLNDFNDLD